MSANLTDIPAIIIQGETPSWPVSLADYLATDGWTLICKLVGSAGVVTITAVADGIGYLFAPTAAQSVTWPAGQYQFQYYVERGSGQSLERTVVGSGTITVQQGFATITTATDTRSHARRTLAAIEAVIEGRASRSDAEYTIDTGNTRRQLKSVTIDELLKLRGIYAARVWREDNPGKVGPAVTVTFPRDRYSAPWRG